MCCQLEIRYLIAAICVEIWKIVEETTVIPKLQCITGNLNALRCWARNFYYNKTMKFNLALIFSARSYRRWFIEWIEMNWNEQDNNNNNNTAVTPNEALRLIIYRKKNPYEFVIWIVNDAVHSFHHKFRWIIKEISKQ